MLGVGFVAILVLAWFHGERGQQKASGIELLMLAALFIIAAIGVTVVSRKGGAEQPVANAALSTPAERRSIAVLPFASLSADPENGYFAEGIHNELLTQLAGLSDLKVISRTSVMAYANTQKTVRDIAMELGVATVLQGTVQKSGTKVRVQAQLIDAKTDDHLWAQTYNGELTDVFEMQTDIARQITGALDATLTDAEQTRIAQRPTENAEAYDLYLQGREYGLKSDHSLENLRESQRLLEQATKLDPEFTLAYVWLAEAHGWMHWLSFDPTSARKEMQRRAAERALELQPELPDARRAVGLYHYWARRDYERALEEYQIALRGAPNDADLISAIAYVQRRQGKYSEAIAGLERALALDPRNARVHYQLSGTYLRVRRYADAAREADRVRLLEPGYYGSTSVKLFSHLALDGSLDTMRTLLNRTDREEEESHADRVRLEMMSRDFKAALREADAAAPVLSLYADWYPRGLLIGQARAALGDIAGARIAFESARAAADSALRVNEADPRLHIARGRAYAGLGRFDDARKEARRAGELIAATKDRYLEAYYATNRAEILAQIGDVDGAIELLERLIREPSDLSPAILRLDPVWDPLRKDARFQRLAAAAP